jgi:hypothetical protein
MKDVQTGLINASSLNKKGLRRSIIWNLPFALRATIWASTHKTGAGIGHGGAAQELFAEFEANGGKLNYGQVDQMDINLKMIQTELKRAKRSILNPLKIVQAVGNVLDNTGSAFENMTRLAAYKALRDRGVEPKAAAKAVRELTTNFQQHGEWGPKINAMYGFANATIIGGGRMTITITKKPQIALALMAIGALTDMFNYWLDPDRWDSYTEEEKDKEFKLLLDDWVGLDGRIPIGYGINSFITVGRKGSEWWRGKKDDTGATVGPWTLASDVGFSFLNAFAPVSGHTMANIISPTFGDPFIDILQNENNWGNRIMPIASERKEQQKPNTQLFFPNTNPIWIKMAEVIGAFGGGNKVVPGSPLTDHSPETYKHIFTEMVGGAGRTALRLYEMPGKIASGELGPNDIPIARRFIGNPFGAAGAKDEQTSAFYERLTTAKVTMHQGKETVRQYGEKSPEWKEFKKDNKDVMVFYATTGTKFDKLNGKLTKAQKAAVRGTEQPKGLTPKDFKAIKSGTGITPPVGRQLTKEDVAKINAEIKRRRELLADRFNQMWRTQVLKEKEE